MAQQRGAVADLCRSKRRHAPAGALTRAAKTLPTLLGGASAPKQGCDGPERTLADPPATG
jgi:hypothetical protein